MRRADVDGAATGARDAGADERSGVRFVAARRLGAAAPAPRTGRHDRDDPVAHGARAWPAEWSRARRVAAEMCVLRGMSARRAAASSGENLRAVLRQVRTLRELAAEWWATARRDGHAQGAGGVR